MRVSRLISEATRSVLKEYMEVWRNDEITDLAKQIYVDFENASKLNDTRAKKSYNIDINGTPYTVNVQVARDRSKSLDGTHNEATHTITLFLGYNVTLKDIQETLFHEATHAIDTNREKTLNKPLFKNGIANLRIGRNRETKVLKLINRICYRLFDDYEFNAWQSLAAHGRTRVEHDIKSLRKIINDLETHVFKHEEQAYPIVCDYVFKKSGLKYYEAKKYFIELAKIRLEKFKRKVTKNLAQYDSESNSNTEGFQPQLDILSNGSDSSTDILTRYKNYISSNADKIAMDIINYYYKNKQNPYELSQKPFTLKYKDGKGNDTINVRVVNFLGNIGTGFDGKKYDVQPILAITDIERALGMRGRVSHEEMSTYILKAKETLVKILNRINE